MAKVLFFVLLAAAISALAQEAGKLPPRPEIRGVVSEPGTNQPVAEADVTLEVHGATRPRLMPSRPKSTVTTKTDASGAFAFRPDDIGYFNISAKKDGYSELRSMPGAPSSAQEITLSAADPIREVHLFLSRPCQITGFVVDEETGKPITVLRLRAVPARRRGSFFPFGGGEGTTDAQGRFVVANLTPGSYAIEVIPQKVPEERVLSTFSEKDLKVVDQDFERTYWPGGHGADTASPVTLMSGSTVDTGVLRVKKTPYYRVHVRFPGWNCDSGDTTNVSVHYRDEQSSSIQALAVVPCGRDVLVTGFPPGAHRLMFGLNKSLGGRSGGAAVSFVIAGENIEVTATLERPTPLDGAFVAADGTRLPDLSQVAVRLGPASRILLMMDLSAPVKADSAGKFRIEALPVEAHRLTVSGVGPGYYVKEIRYNGAPVTGDIVPLNSSALTQSLIIVLDDKPAVITGVVVKGDKPVNRPRLILLRWPPPSGDMPLTPTATVTGDEKGRFRFGGLAPGEYRLIGLPRSNLQDPDAYEKIRNALAAAPKIEAGANTVHNLTIEVTDLR